MIMLHSESEKLLFRQNAMFSFQNGGSVNEDKCAIQGPKISAVYEFYPRILNASGFYFLSILKLCVNNYIII